MKSTFFVNIKQSGLFFIIVTLVLYPMILLAQGRTLTRANAFNEKYGLEPGDYLKIEELVVFEGTWQWVSAAGDSVFTLQLWREKFVPPQEMKTFAFSYDGIAGHYSLAVNGAIVLSNTHKQFEQGYPTFGGTDMENDGVDKLEINFQDFLKNKWAKGRFELFRDNLNMARWSMRNEGIIVVPTGTVFHRGFSLPNNVVLHRVHDTPPEPILPPGWEVQ